MDQTVRPYRAEDAAAVREVHERAFAGRREDAHLVEMLHAAGAAPVSLVAATEPGGRVVGHVLFSPVRVDGSESGPPPMVGLAPVGVLPECQGRGTGSRLILEGLEACRRAGYGAAVVLGEPSYYSRFGFERASGMGLGNEYGTDEYFMVAELGSGTLDDVVGTVRYREGSRAQLHELGNDARQVSGDRHTGRVAREVPFGVGPTGGNRDATIAPEGPPDVERLRKIAWRYHTEMLPPPGQ